MLTSSLLISLMPLLLAATGDLDAAEKAFAAGRYEEAIDLLGDLGEGKDAPQRALLILGRSHRACLRLDLAVEPLLHASNLAEGDRALAAEAAGLCLEVFQQGVVQDSGAYLVDARRMAERAQDPFLLANVLFAMEDYSAALVQYGKSAVDPARKLASLQGRAECLSALGRTEEARLAHITCLEEAMAQQDLAQAYRSAFAADQAGRFASWLDARVKERPDDLRLRRYRGFTYGRLQLWRESSDDLRLVVSSRPDDLDCGNEYVRSLLQLYSQNQDLQARSEAERLASDLVQHTPAESEARKVARENLLWLGQQRYLNSEFTQSLELLRVLRESDPRDLDVGLSFGAVARRLGRYDEAKGIYEALLKEYEEHPDILNDLGILLDGMGDRPGAVALWERTLKEEPENLNALENLVTASWEAGDREGAARHAGQGLAAALRQRRAVDRWRWFVDRLSWAPVAASPVAPSAEGTAHH